MCNFYAAVLIPPRYRLRAFYAPRTLTGFLPRDVCSLSRDKTCLGRLLRQRILPLSFVQIHCIVAHAPNRFLEPRFFCRSCHTGKCLRRGGARSPSNGCNTNSSARISRRDDRLGANTTQVSFHKFSHKRGKLQFANDSNLKCRIAWSRLHATAHQGLSSPHFN